MKIFFNSHLRLVTVLFILLISAFLRLYRISEYMTFLGDEGRDVMVVKKMIVDHKFTLLGPTSSVGGFFLGPVYYYFMAPFLWIWRLDPTGPAIMVALFGIGTVYLIYHVGTRLFHPVVGISASLLYALSPLVIAYSRSSWNPNLVPFFSLLTVYFCYRSVESQRKRDFFLTGIFIGIGLQLHYVFLFLIAMVFFWYVLMGRKKDLLPGYLLLCAGFLTGFFPYLLFELRHGFPNTQTIIRFILYSEETKFSLPSFFATIQDVSFRLFGRLLLRYPQPEILRDLPPIRLAFWNAIVSAISSISLGILVYKTFYKNHTGNSRNPYSMMLLWFLVPVILFGFYRKGIYDYYFGIFYAFPFLCFGIIIWHLVMPIFYQHKFTTTSLYQMLKTYFPIVFAGVLFIVILVFNYAGRPFLYPPNRQLSHTKEIAQAVFDASQGKPFNFALLAVGNSDHAYRYFFEIWGNPPVVIENEIHDPERKTVTDRLIVLCDMPEDQCKPLGHPLWEIAGFVPSEIQNSTKASYMTVMTLVHYNSSQ